MLCAFKTRQLDIQTGIKSLGGGLSLVPGHPMVAMEQIDARIVGDHQAIKAPLVRSTSVNRKRDAWQGSLSIS